MFMFSKEQQRLKYTINTRNVEYTCIRWILTFAIRLISYRDEVEEPRLEITVGTYGISYNDNRWRQRCFLYRCAKVLPINLTRPRFFVIWI